MVPPRRRAGGCTSSEQLEAIARLMYTRPSVDVASRGSQLPRISYRIRAALLLYASPVFDNKRIICRARDAIARLNAACALLRSRRVYLLYRVSQKWRLAFLHPAHSAPACNMPPNHRRRCHVSARKAAGISTGRSQSKEPLEQCK